MGALSRMCDRQSYIGTRCTKHKDHPDSDVWRSHQFDWDPEVDAIEEMLDTFFTLKEIDLIWDYHQRRNQAISLPEEMIPGILSFQKIVESEALRGISRDKTNRRKMRKIHKLERKLAELKER